MAVALGATALTGAPATASPTPPLAWHACASNFRCAQLAVPLDYAHPAAGTVKLALIELPATGTHVVGDLVLNPGGPGASGLELMETTSFPPSLRASFNLVSFDPRGVGQSDPVNCVGVATLRSLIALNPTPSTPAQVSSVVAATKAFDAACAQHTSLALLKNVGTIDTVQDLDRIRAALGQDQLDYLGFSYGTYLGELYAEEFPQRVRAMVLDGVVDPSLSVSGSTAQQAEAFEGDLKDFFAWCGHDKSCAQELPQGAQPAYEQLFHGLSNGLSLFADLKPQAGGRQRVTLGVAETALLGSLYSDQGWPLLAEALQEALAGNGGLLAALAYDYEELLPGQQGTNLVAANAAISCVDQAYPSSLSTYEQLAASLSKVAPDFGAADAWSNLDCAYWPVHGQEKRGPVSYKGAHPILVVGSTGDPATPYPWAKTVARQLGNARLLTREGPGHTAYFFSNCIQTWTDRYLQTLQLPPPGTVCQSSS